MKPAPNLELRVLLRSEETGGHVSVTEIVVPPHSPGPPLHTHAFERHWARSAAEGAGVEPPPWALQPIPGVTVVGPHIARAAMTPQP